MTPDATDILRSLGKKYAAAAAYRDRGRVLLTPVPNTVAQGTVAKFRTAFLRSKGFRFEYREVPLAKRCFGIRVDRGKVIDVQGFNASRESVNLALAGVTGITFGAAHCVIAMLLPDEIEGRTLSKAPSAKLVGRSSIDGRSCFMMGLEGFGSAQVFVDESFTLRRVSREPSALSTTATAQSNLFRVIAYDEAELFSEEPQNIELDW
jgi:hypothetical protein